MTSKHPRKEIALALIDTFSRLEKAESLLREVRGELIAAYYGDESDMRSAKRAWNC